MNSKDKISFHQFLAIATISLFSPATRQLPRAAVKLAGNAAWLAPVAALIPCILLCTLFIKFVSTRRENEGLADIFLRCLGPFFGRIVIFIFAAWTIFYAGFIVRSGAERLLSTVYDIDNLPMFVLVIAFAAIPVMLGKLTPLARMAEIFLPILVGAIILIFFSSIQDVQIKNLLPVSRFDAKNILLAAMPVINTISPWVYITFLYGGVIGNGKEISMTARRIGFGVVAILMLLITNIGILGVGLIEKLQFPFFIMIKDISIFNVLERIEAVIIGMWVITDFIFFASLLMSGGEIIRVGLGHGNRKLINILCSVAAVIFALTIGRTLVDYTVLSEVIVPIINAAILFGLLPMVCLICILRNKGKKDKKGIDKGGEEVVY